MIQIIFRTALPLLPLLVDLIGGIDVAVGKNIIFAESPDNISEIILLLLAEILKIRRRGVIAGTSHGASLSKKYLLGRGTPARMLAGKDLRIRLTRWDENAQKFNAELG